MIPPVKRVADLTPDLHTSDRADGKVGRVGGGEDGECGAETEAGAVCVGSLVIARWRNNSWYPATVTDDSTGRSATQLANPRGNARG